MKNTNPLDFLVIGTQKAATSWLYNCLADHPELYLPKRKKEVEYLGGPLHQKHGSDWYFSLMAGGAPGQLRGDVSIEYMFDPGSPNAIQKHVSRVKLIVSLRDPVERAVSAFYWGTRKGYLEATSLDEGLKRAMDAYLNNNQDALSGMRAKYAEIIRRGLYAKQITRYRLHFPDSDFCILFYDSIRGSPNQVVEQVYSFLGVDSGFVPPKINRRPKQNSDHGLLIRLERMAPRTRLFAGILDRINMRLAPSKPSTPDLDPQLVETMQAFYAPHNAELHNLLDQMKAGGASLSEAEYPSWL
jgi:hypothetical protein